MARSNNGSVSAYAAYETAKGVKGLGTYIPADLYAVLNKVMPESSDGAIIKAGLEMLANTRPDLVTSLKGYDTATGAYEIPGRAKRETVEEKAKRETAEAKSQLADALAQIATLKAQLIPTPPPVIADAATGKLVRK